MTCLIVIGGIGQVQQRTVGDGGAGEMGQLGLKERVKSIDIDGR